MRPTHGESADPAVSRRFILTAALGGVLFGLLVRLRIHLASPLPSTQPARWFLLGILEDMGVLLLAAAAAAAFARGRVARLVPRAFGAFVLAWCLCAFLLAEVIVYFGHPPRAEDLSIAASPSFWRFSIGPAELARAAAAVVATLLLLAAAARMAARGRPAGVSPGALATFGMAALALVILPLPVDLAATARNPAFAAATLSRSIAGGHAPGGPRATAPSAPLTAIRTITGNPSRRRFLDPGFPLAYRPAERSAAAPRLPPGVRPNIVFFVMEGVRAHEVGAYGSTVPGVTPNLDALAAQGTRFDGVWSPGTHTPEGELALWYGLLAVPHEIVTLQPRVSMTGLPEILRRAGWRSFLWIHDSDQTFFGEDRFFLPRGFRMIDGRDFDPGEPRTNWGFSDLTLARRAALALDRMEEPFAAMVLTISNHHPFQLPSDAKTRLDVPAAEETGSFRLPGWRSLVGRQTVPMLRTVHYTDEALGDFFDRIRPRPWFSRTVFVVVSDHGLPVAPLGGVSSLHRFVELRHGVPWILYSPLLPAGPAVPGPSSLADVPPTLLGFLGVRLPASGVGCDRLDPAACDPERPVFSWNEEGEMLTIATASRVYHAVFASERVSGGAGGSPGEEMLFAGHADPEGRRDLSLSEPERVREFRKLARTYLEVYPWLVSNGRSGVPDADLPEGGRPTAP